MTRRINAGFELCEEARTSVRLGPQLFLQGVKDLIHRATLAAIDRNQPFPHRLDRFQPLRQVEQMLIRFGILHDYFGLAIDGQHERMTTFLELTKKRGCIAFEIGQRVRSRLKFMVLPEIAPLKHYIRCYHDRGLSTSLGPEHSVGGALIPGGIDALISRRD